MITINKFHFIILLIVVILSTIVIYNKLIPCNQTEVHNIKQKKRKIKYVPIYIIDKKNNDIKEEENKDDKNLNYTNDNNIEVINGNISSHSQSIVPSVWNDDFPSNFEFEY